MENVKDYLKSLSPEIHAKVCEIMVAKKFGYFVPEESGFGDPDCHDHVGCTSSYPNYTCEKVNGVCTAIPDIG